VSSRLTTRVPPSHLEQHFVAVQHETVVGERRHRRVAVALSFGEAAVVAPPKFFTCP
jgi:hypothetical protein